jgi:hypothetical protein
MVEAAVGAKRTLYGIMHPLADFTAKSKEQSTRRHLLGFDTCQKAPIRPR